MIAGVTRRISSPVFVGRRAELGRLGEAFRRADGGQPSVVLVAGEAGVGKSRLMAEFVARVAAADGRALTGGCLDLGGGGPPYAPFAEALRTYVRRLDLDARPAAFGPSTGALVRLVPDLRASAVPADPVAAGADPSGGQAQVFDALIGALEHLSSERPLALIVEDIHWADGSTRDAVRFLVRNFDTQRVALVATYRSDDLHRRHPLMPLLSELERSDRVERLELSRFDRAELAAQLEGILGQPATAELVDTLLMRSNGLPFYVEELMAGQDDGGSSLPATLRDILELRLAALSDASLAVVRAAAVVGGLVPHDRLAAVMEIDDRALVAALGEAVGAGILLPADGPEGPTYEFRHALLREAAFDELLPAERVRLDLRLADHLDALLETLPAPDASVASAAAVHAYEAHDLPRALSSAVRAVQALVAATAYREALGHAERALELWARVVDATERAGMDHAALVALASQIAASTNQPERAVTLGREAVVELESSTDSGRLAAVLADLYMFEWEARDFEASEASVRRAYGLVKDREDSRLKAFVVWMMGWERWWAGSLAESVQLHETAMAVADGIGDRAVWADAAGALAHTLADLGYASQAAALADKSAASVSDFDGRPMSLWVVPDRAIAWWTAGRFDDAMTAASDGLEQAMRYGWEARLGGDLRACMADALFETGRYDEAQAVLRPILTGGGIWNSPSWARQTMTRIAIVQGRFDEAHRYLDELVPVGSAGAAEFFDALLRVELARAEGRFEAVQVAVEAGLVGRSRGESVAGLWTLLGAAIGACADTAVSARKRRRPGDATEAANLAESCLPILRSVADRGRAAGGAGPFIEATLATAEAEAGRVRGPSDPDAWGVATANWRALVHPYQAGYAGLRFAESIMATSGDRTLAGEVLRKAYESAWTIGAVALVRELEALADRGRLDLGGLGGRSADASSGPTAAQASPSLTTRERAVLRLVAEGHTNREIGTRLFISEKTVSVHVSNAMAKLDALSRYEAAATGERLGLI
jgi:ATP/maltotriose-dependent transcriptional regulator MalT